MSTEYKQAIIEFTKVEGATFGECVQAIRDALNITRQQLAKTVGIRSNDVKKIEKGSRLPCIEEVVGIVEAYKLPLDPFLTIYFQDVLTSASIERKVRVYQVPRARKVS